MSDAINSLFICPYPRDEDLLSGIEELEEDVPLQQLEAR